MSLFEELMGQLEVREVKDMLSHEQVIAPNLKRLKVAMLNIGHLVDPVVVDGKTGVVLDGNHRKKVLEIIECPLSVCQIVDYQDPEIKVGTWYPSVKLSPEEISKLDSIKYEKVDEAAGREAVDNLKAPFMLSGGGENYLLNPGQYKLMEMVEEQNYVLSLLEKNCVDYIPDEEFSKHKGMGRSIFYRRAYTKDEVVKCAQGHAPFPPKSTRHLIPGRIIRLNMKLGWLHRTPELAMGELKRMLKVRAYTGNVRKYYEPVVVIY